MYCEKASASAPKPYFCALAMSHAQTIRMITEESLLSAGWQMVSYEKVAYFQRGGKQNGDQTIRSVGCDYIIYDRCF